MKYPASITFTCLLVAGIAHAGFRYPLGDTGLEAEQIQRTPERPALTKASAKRLIPDRVADIAPSQPAAKAASVASTAKAAPAVYGPSIPPNFHPSLPANVKVTPTQASTALKAPINAKASPTEQKPAKISDQPRVPVRQGAKPASVAASKTPIPKAPDLPEKEHFGIPNVNVPSTMNRDGLLTMGAPEKLKLRDLNRAQIYAYLKHARELPLPSTEYTAAVRAKPITEHYKDALHPVPGKSFRTAYSLNLAKVGKIEEPASLLQYENMVKRVDALFMALDIRYARSVMNLWQLAQSSSNARNFQARDALFAGLISARAGWDTTAALFYEEAAAKLVDHDDRYLKILWNQLESVSNPVLLDKIVQNVSPLRVRDASPAGDRANFAMAKRMLLRPTHVPFQIFPNYEVIQQRIVSSDLRDKLSLIALIGQLRSPDEKRRLAAMGAIRTIESGANEENRQQAQLALARTLMQHGGQVEALELYRKVKKDRKNRLSVLGEQTYAEYVNGAYQDALGKTVALESPYFQYGYAPDIHLVEIMTRKAMCDFGGAEEGVRRFGERYARELHALDQVLQRKVAPAIFYEELMGYVDQANPFRFQRYLLQLTAVMENQNTMNDALKEFTHLDGLGMHQKTLERPEGWDEFTASMRNRWEDRATDMRRVSGETALAEASYMEARLRKTFEQVELLDLDISTSASKNYDLENAMNFPATKQEEAKLKQDQYHWGFENEIWEDEIDYMKAKNPPKCAQTKTAAI